MSRKTVTIAVTVGDPLSIGPEVSAKAMSAFLNRKKKVCLHCYSPRSSFSRGEHRILKKFEESGQLEFKSARDRPRPKRPGIASATIAIESLESAISACLSKDAQALVTGPVDKDLCSRIVPGFSGHTEFLQKRCRSRGTTMLLSSKELKVALVTTHLPLKKVSSHLSGKSICETVDRVVEHLSARGRPAKVAVCALNPHASDNGLFGDEEGRIISPAIRKLQSRYGSRISGPHPADTLFAHSSAYDAIVCMYHDQGLIPLKMSHFYDAVNVTLGLPFLRTSVDHGTAFSLVGKNSASHESYLRALEYAYEWIRTRHSNSRSQRA